MGFNNPGAEAFAQTLAGWKKCRWPNHPVGINLGKSKVTPLAQAAEDYANSFRILRDYADFFVINVSSPNTPGLRQLQDKAALDEILAAVCQIQKSGTHHPAILVKVAPDLSFEALDEILELATARNLSGIVATNTTITRPEPSNTALEKIYTEAGGLSGAPLRARSTEVISHIFKQTRGQLPIIGVGGIFSANDALEKIAAGASLLQIYTGLVYEGPGLTKKIVSGLAREMKNRGIRSFKEMVGMKVS
jgi:dihydroorotate dehydrogenase